MVKPALILLIIALALVGLVLSKRQDEIPQPDKVVLESPMPNARVASPLIVTGRARGNWFFEASFPIRLIDAQDRIIGKAVAQAREDWMTTDFVPFAAELAFVIPTTTARGVLVLERDNPSALPEHADEVRIPVRFSSSVMSVKVFFTTRKTGIEPNFDCKEVEAVARYIPKTVAPARAAIEELLKGPTPGEQTLGYATGINKGVVIRKLSIRNGIASIDFNGRLEEDIGGSCYVASIRSQIGQTLIQFPTVRTVVISIDGRTEPILQP